MSGFRCGRAITFKLWQLKNAQFWRMVADIALNQVHFINVLPLSRDRIDLSGDPKSSGSALQRK